MEKILSIIIPMYQVEQYIKQCLDSFVIQELFQYIEILIINDGSKDQSTAFAEEYEKNYPNTFRVIHKENGGHGSTINKGIKQALGKYFKVIDGDDCVERDAFYSLVQYLKQTDSDIIWTNYYWMDHNTGKRSIEIKTPFVDVDYKTEYEFRSICDKLFIKMHAMTIKTSILRENQITIGEHCYYVDMEYITFPIPFIKTITFLPDFVYLYRIGLPTQSMNPEKMRKQVDQHKRVINRLLDFYQIQKNQHLRKPYLTYIKGVINRMIASQFKIYLSFPIGDQAKEELIQFDAEIKQDYPEIYNTGTNQGVLMLRKSKFTLYKIAAFALRLKERN